MSPTIAAVFGSDFWEVITQQQVVSRFNPVQNVNGHTDDLILCRWSIRCAFPLKPEDAASVSNPFPKPLSMWLALREALNDATRRDDVAAKKQA